MATVKDADHIANRSGAKRGPEPEPDPLAGLARLFDSGSPTPPEPGSPTPPEPGRASPEDPPQNGVPAPTPTPTPNPTLADPAKREAHPDPEGPPNPDPGRDPTPKPTLADPAQRETHPDPEGPPNPGPGGDPEQHEQGGFQQEPREDPTAGVPLDPDPGGYVVTFDPPRNVGPLLPPEPDPAKAPGEKPKPPQVAVPLEPILAGATAAALNGLFLAAPEDGDMTLAEVRSTGWPLAVEGAMRHYFPDLAIDHPLTAVIASGASLALLVASKKGINANAPPPALPEPRPEPEATDADPEPEPDPNSPTGDPYWDSILQQAGGPRHG